MPTGEVLQPCTLDPRKASFQNLEIRHSGNKMDDNDEIIYIYMRVRNLDILAVLCQTVYFLSFQANTCF